MSGTRSRLTESSPATRGSAFLLAAVGCLGIAGQLVLLRELMAAYGGNEFSAGVTVAAWTLCEALGAWLASRLSSRLPSPHSLLATLSVLSSLAAVPAATLARPLLGVLPGETLSIPLLLLATFVVVFLPAASHGALFVTAAAIHAQGTPDRASDVAAPATGSVGSAYIWEGIGTALAGLACYLLLNRLQSLAIIALFSLLIAAALLRLRPSDRRLHPSAFVLTSSALLAAVSVAASVMALPIERMAWGAAWRGQRVAAVVNSPYGKIVRLERAGQQLILYDGLPVLTVPTIQTERVEELALLPVLLHPAPRRVLVLGHDLAIPAALARFRPDIRVVTVQLDPVLARTSLAALSGDPSFTPPSFALVISDPAVFLRTTRDAFDCIILTDAAPSSLGSSRLFAVEFYRLCRLRLAPGGMLATAGPGNPTSLSPDAARILSTRVRTLKASFEQVLPVAADFPLLLASDRPLNVATETLVSRLAALSEQPKLLDSNYVSGLLDPFRQRALTSALQTDASGGHSSFVVRRSSSAAAAPVGQRGISTAAFPRELFLNVVRENRLASPVFGTLYARLGNLSPRLLLLLGLALLVVGLIGAFSRGHPFSRGFAIATSGFSGAAVSSLLIFAWQVRFGSVFSGVALLVAAFMLGTVLGGILGSRSSFFVLGSWFFFAADLVLTVCAAAAALLIHGGPTGAFLAANCVAGACLGFQFALAGAGATASSAGRRAGVLTALDLAGGGLGGILTALVIVPVFGIGAAALFAGAVKLTSALTQLMPGRPVSQP